MSKPIPVTQYLRPHGKQRPQFTEVSDEAAVKFAEIEALGLALTAEIIPPDCVHVCISDGQRGEDYDSVLVPNGPGLQEAISGMLLRFDGQAYRRWAEDASK